jgi:hypothetical protein
MNFRKKKTCKECACFLPYFIVTSEREHAKGISDATISAIVSDPTNPNKNKMFCAKTVQETKETNKACSGFLKREGSSLTWQELEKKKQIHEEEKNNKRTLWIAIISLFISAILAIKELLGYVFPH